MSLANVGLFQANVRQLDLLRVPRERVAQFAVGNLDGGVEKLFDPAESQLVADDPLDLLGGEAHRGQFFADKAVVFLRVELSGSLESRAGP